jgi:hypothetical protein
LCRNSNHQLGARVSAAGWDSYLFLSPDTLIELRLCLKYFDHFNGVPIIRETAYVPVFSPSQVDYLISNVDPELFDRPLNTFFSDSGSECAFFFKAGDIVLQDEYFFTPSERTLSSSYRELKAVFLAFSVHKDFFISQKGSVILWITDNQCVFSYLSKGSKVPKIQRLLISIKDAEYEAGVVILPKWVPRTDQNIVIADLGSKLHTSSDEYGIDHFSFLFLQERFHLTFTVDGFASKFNKRTSIFFSLIPQTGSQGVNFFFHNLKINEVYFLHPPTSLLRRLFNKIIMYQDVTCVVVCPVWFSHNFWSFIIQQGFFIPCIKDYVIFDPIYCPFSNFTMFKGKKSFKTIAFLIKTKEFNRIPSPF